MFVVSVVLKIWIFGTYIELQGDAIKRKTV